MFRLKKNMSNDSETKRNFILTSQKHKFIHFFAVLRKILLHKNDLLPSLFYIPNDENWIITIAITPSIKDALVLAGVIAVLRHF